MRKVIFQGLADLGDDYDQVTPRMNSHAEAVDWYEENKSELPLDLVGQYFVEDTGMLTHIQDFRVNGEPYGD